MREEWKLGHYLKDVSSAPYQTSEKNNSYKMHVLEDRETWFPT